MNEDLVLGVPERRNYRAPNAILNEAMTTSHHIKKLTIDLRVKSKEAGRALQEDAGELFRSELPEVLDEVFQTFSPDQRVVLDRLELELPVYTDEDAFYRNFLDDVRDLLMRRLSEKRPHSNVFSSSDAWLSKHRGYDEGKIEKVMFHFLGTGSLPWNADGLPRDELVSLFIDVLQSLRSVQRRLQQLLLDSASARDRLVRQCKDLELARMLTAFEQKPFTPAAIETTLTLFRFLSEVHQRIAQQPGKQTPRIRTWNLLIEAISFSAVHNEGSESVAFARAIGFAVRSVAEMLEDLHHTSATTEQVQTLLEELQLIFEGPVSEGLRNRPELRPPLDRAAERLAEFAGEFRERRAALSRPEGIPKSRSESPEQVLESNLIRSRQDGDQEKRAVVEPAPPRPAILRPPDMGDSETHIPTDARPLQESENVVDVNAQVLEHRVSDFQGEEARTEMIGIRHDKAPDMVNSDSGSQTQRLSTPYHIESVEPETTFYIDNAGLVLLAPFFRQLFNKLGYLDDASGFRDKQTQVRAVLLTQFIVEWDDELPEYKLPLNKLLCGYELMEPIDLEFEIRREEKAEVEDLLESMITAWSALKKTSIEGFRQSFLPRQGVLHFDGTVWLLQVERTSIDVLLDTVPWTCSAVKHPWMQSSLMVEW